MATVEDVAYSALAAIDTNAGISRAIRWTSERLQELHNKVKLRAVREIGEIVIPATIDDGTASVTRGDTIITGDATAQPAWAGVDATLVGRYIRFTSRNEWYRIGSVVTTAGVTSLRLESEFADDTVTSGAYKIIQRYHMLDPRTRFLGKFVFMRFRRELTQTALDSLDIDQPDRLLTNSAGPEYVVEVGTGSDGRRIVEFYPYPSNTEIIHYVFWPRIDTLAPGDTLPHSVDPYVLKHGVLIDLMRYEMSRALAAGTIEAAAVWRNDYRAQQTVWEGSLADVQKADKGLDDVTIILRSSTFSFGNSRPFRNDSARSEIFFRGDRP